MVIVVWAASCGVQMVGPNRTGYPRKTPTGVCGVGMSSYLGTLEVSGAAVFMNGSNVPSGTALCSGDTVSTGLESSALIRLTDGGTVQLYQETDPFFQLLTQGACLLIKMVNGQLFEDDQSGRCIVINTPDGTGVTGSAVNVRVTAEGTSWLVVHGAVRLDDPKRSTVHPSELVTVSRGTVIAARPLPGGELAALTEWRSHYTFPLGTRATRIPPGPAPYYPKPRAPMPIATPAPTPAPPKEKGVTSKPATPSHRPGLVPRKPVPLSTPTPNLIF